MTRRVSVVGRAVVARANTLTSNPAHCSPRLFGHRTAGIGVRAVSKVLNEEALWKTAVGQAVLASVSPTPRLVLYGPVGGRHSHA